MMTQIRYLGQPLILNQSMEVNRTVLRSCALYDPVSMPKDTNLRCMVVSMTDLVIYLVSFAVIRTQQSKYCHVVNFEFTGWQ